MSNRQVLTTLATQPVLASAGTPQRISSTDLWVRSVEIQAHTGNTGVVFFASSSALCTLATGRSLAAGSEWQPVGDQFFSHTVQINLREIWFDGITTGNKLVVTYMVDS